MRVHLWPLANSARFTTGCPQASGYNLRKLEARGGRWGKRQQCPSLTPRLTSSLSPPKEPRFWWPPNAERLAKDISAKTQKRKGKATTDVHGWTRMAIKQEESRTCICWCRVNPTLGVRWLRRSRTKLLWAPRLLRRDSCSGALAAVSFANRTTLGRDPTTRLGLPVRLL
jgi:hypothetical protein